MPIDPRRGEVWRVDLEPTRGAEMQKTRPAVVLSSDRLGRLPLRLIVPLTGWNEGYAHLAWMARVDPTAANGLTKLSAANGLTKLSAADAFQTRGASLERFGDRLGILSEETLARITRALALTVEYQP